MFYSLEAERLTASVGAFLAALSPERPAQGQPGKKKGKPADKGPTRKKHKGLARGRAPEPVERARLDNDGSPPGLAPGDLGAGE